MRSDLPMVLDIYYATTSTTHSHKHSSDDSACMYIFTVDYYQLIFATMEHVGDNVGNIYVELHICCEVIIPLYLPTWPRVNTRQIYSCEWYYWPHVRQVFHGVYLLTKYTWYRNRLGINMLSYMTAKVESGIFCGWCLSTSDANY